MHCLLLVFTKKVLKSCNRFKYLFTNYIGKEISTICRNNDQLCSFFGFGEVNRGNDHFHSTFKTDHCAVFCPGAGEGIRTPDLLITNQLRYRCATPARYSENKHTDYIRLSLKFCQVSNYKKIKNIKTAGIFPQ